MTVVIPMSLSSLFHPIRRWMTLGRTSFFTICVLLVLVANIGILHRIAFLHDEEKSVMNGERKTTSMITDVITPRNDVSKDESSSARETVAACLLLKDDNDILPEWLAYHFHNLQMRELIVAVDPTSQNSPQSILEQWTKWTDLNATIWSDEDFMPPTFLATGYHTSPDKVNGNAKESQWHQGHEDEATVIADTVQILNHRFRQITFLQQCLRRFQQQGNTWVMHVDTDEFVVVNPLLRNTTQKNVEMIHVPQTMAPPGTVLNVLNQFLTTKEGLQRKINYPCVSMPRLLFGSLENTTTPNSSNNSVFETLRWRYHTNFTDTDRNAQPKVIIDVSRVHPQDSMFEKPFSIHRPSMRLCRRLDQLNFHQLQRYPISVNHYMGSWERYNAKNDTRRSRRAYNRKAVLDTAIRDDDHDLMETWLPGFLEHTPHAREAAGVSLQHSIIGLRKHARGTIDFLFLSTTAQNRGKLGCRRCGVVQEALVVGQQQQPVWGA